LGDVASLATYLRVGDDEEWLSEEKSEPDAERALGEPRKVNLVERPEVGVPTAHPTFVGVVVGLFGPVETVGVPENEASEPFAAVGGIAIGGWPLGSCMSEIRLMACE
jgi:hypothetical protein